MALQPVWFLLSVLYVVALGVTSSAYHSIYWALLFTCLWAVTTVLLSVVSTLGLLVCLLLGLLVWWWSSLAPYFTRSTNSLRSLFCVCMAKDIHFVLRLLSLRPASTTLYHVSLVKYTISPQVHLFSSCTLSCDFPDSLCKHSHRCPRCLLCYVEGYFMYGSVWAASD